MNEQFIKMIGDAAVAAYPEYKILPSLTIAQAILESGWGESALSRECYNYFGMKWKAGCGCDYKEYETREQRKDGTYYTVKAKFRKYPDAASGIEGYYKFLSGYKRYHNLIGVTDSGMACDLIRKDGWATSLEYSKKLKNIVSKYNLTAYDAKVIDTNTITVRVEIHNLNVRTGPGIDYPRTGEFARTGSHVIKEIKPGKGSDKGWGRIEDGWISLDYAI